MRLSELEPRWIHANMFVFECPHCRKTGRKDPVLLTCKNVQMTRQEAWDIIMAAVHREGDELAQIVVPPKPECAWHIGGQDFAVMSVTPSIDASDAGHWHGHITNGEIVGGNLR